MKYKQMIGPVLKSVFFIGANRAAKVAMTGGWRRAAGNIATGILSDPKKAIVATATLFGISNIAEGAVVGRISGWFGATEDTFPIRYGGTMGALAGGLTGMYMTRGPFRPLRAAAITGGAMLGGAFGWGLKIGAPPGGNIMNSNRAVNPIW